MAFPARTQRRQFSVGKDHKLPEAKMQTGSNLCAFSEVNYRDQTLQLSANERGACENVPFLAWRKAH